MHNLIFPTFINLFFKGEGKCFNKLFSVFKRTLLHNTSLDALDISVSAENQSLSTCQMERHIGPINETEVNAKAIMIVFFASHLQLFISKLKNDFH